MGILKTLSLAMALSMGIPHHSAALTEGRPDDCAQIFATCLGRYSAEVTHLWLLSEDATAAESRRALYQMLFDAAAPRSDVSPPVLLDMRIRAKMAQAHLLRIASFHTDPANRTRAAAAARRAMRPCALLILT